MASTVCAEEPGIEGMCKRLEARINALEEEGQEKDERFKAQEERFEARSKAQDAVIQGLLTTVEVLSAAVETATEQTRVLVKTGAAVAASDGGTSATAGSRARQRRRSSLSGGGELGTQQTQLAVWNNPVFAGTNLSANEEEEGSGRGAGGQAQAWAEDTEGVAMTTAGAGVEGTDSGGGGGGGGGGGDVDSGGTAQVAVGDAAGDAPDGVDAAPAGRMLGLQVFLMCSSFLPIMGFQGIGALWLDHAPSHLMTWAHVPIALMSCATHCFITVELSEAPSWLEEVHLLGIIGSYACTVSPYYMKQGFGWVILGFVVWLIVLYAAGRVAITRIRAAARAHHLRAGTLGELVDGTFLIYLEFMVVIAYGFLSSVACLVAVEVDHPTDLLDGEMWGECGPVTMVRRAPPLTAFARLTPPPSPQPHAHPPSARRSPT